MFRVALMSSMDSRVEEGEASEEKGAIVSPKTGDAHTTPRRQEGPTAERRSRRECFICGKLNHIAKDCRWKPKSAAAMEETEVLSSMILTGAE